MTTPARLISVVIPTRDRNESLARCLDRLAPCAQSLAHDQYEVVVADDSAHAAARELIFERYPWVRWTGGPRRGPAANRNAGSRIAAGTVSDATVARHAVRCAKRGGARRSSKGSRRICVSSA